RWQAKGSARGMLSKTQQPGKSKSRSPVARKKLFKLCFKSASRSVMSSRKGKKEQNDNEQRSKEKAQWAWVVPQRPCPTRVEDTIVTNINLYGRPDKFRFFEPKPQPVTVREFQVLEATSVFAGEGTLDQIAAYLSPRLGPESFGIAF